VLLAALTRRAAAAAADTPNEQYDPVINHRHHLTPAGLPR